MLDYYREYIRRGMETIWQTLQVVPSEGRAEGSRWTALWSEGDVCIVILHVDYCEIFSS